MSSNAMQLFFFLVLYLWAIVGWSRGKLPQDSLVAPDSKFGKRFIMASYVKVPLFVIYRTTDTWVHSVFNEYILYVLLNCVTKTRTQRLASSTPIGLRYDYNNTTSAPCPGIPTTQAHLTSGPGAKGIRKEEEKEKG